MRTSSRPAAWALLLLSVACRRGTGPETSAASDASVAPPAATAPGPRTIAEAANQLGWELLARRPEPARALIAPFSLSRALLRRSGGASPEGAPSWQVRAFGARPAMELTLGIENLQDAFTRHAALASIPMRLEGTAEGEPQSRVLEVALKAIWQQRFEHDRTALGTFHGRDGPEAEVPFMRQLARLLHAETEQYTVLELPFREERLSFLLWLPRPGVSMEELGALLAASGGALGIEAMASRLVELRLPKSVLREESSLTALIEELEGSSSAGSGAPFELAQRVSLELGEEGSDGPPGGAPVVGVRSPGPPPLPIAVDRPFAFAVRDRPSKAMLLIGRVESLLP